MAPARPPIASLRGATAALTLLAGLLNVAVAPGRSSDWMAEGLMIGTVGGLQVALAGALLVSRSYRVIWATGVVNLAVGLALVLVRVIGYPFGPFENYAPPLEPYRIIVLVTSVLAAIGVVVIASRPATGPLGLRFENVAPLVVALAVVPGLHLSSWGDDARHILGAAHVHTATPTIILSPDEQSRLDDELALAAEVARRLPTFADALADGWVISGPTVAGIGQMVVRPDVDFRDVPFDIERPLAYIYSDDSPDAPVVGLEYAQWLSHGETPQGFTGQTPTWHTHMLSCLVDSSYIVPQDDPVTGQSCAKVDGSIDTSMSYMLRVWPLADQPNPDGVFAHDNPTLR
ncbi:MAG: hypothetical protein ACKOCE_04560 [Acidimicrobiia bacterium]